MLARYIRIICGETLLSWDELRRFCLSSISQLPAEVQISMPPQMNWLVGHALSAKTYSYANLLATFSKSQCYDLKDKVYGLQGLLPPEKRIIVNYAQSIEGVFHDAVALMCADVRSTFSVRFGQSVDELEYTKSAAEVLREASSSLNAQAESIIELPLIPAIVELGTAMGLCTQQKYDASPINAILERIQLRWNKILQAYIDNELRWDLRWDFGSDSTIALLAYDLRHRYNELTLLLTEILQLDRRVRNLYYVRRFRTVIDDG
jgi:hypothetical protein